MTIYGFSLGMRFDLLKDNVSDTDIEALLSQITQVLTREDVADLMIYGGVCKLNELDSECVYTVVFMNGKINPMRRLYSVLSEDARLMALSEHRTPFIQNNVIRELGEMEYFGKVEEDGVCKGGSGRKLVFPEKVEKRKTVSDTRTIIAAPNSFKGTIPASVAAKSIMRAYRAIYPDTIVIPVPVADGGDGTLEAIENAILTQRHFMQVTGPYGEKVDAYYLVSDGMTAIIESALASGIALCSDKELDPLSATSYGTGELILRAAHEGIKDIYVCLGGSATNDCGIGLARALGCRFVMKDGSEAVSAAQMKDVAAIDSAGIDLLVKKTNITVLCDVSNKLTGPDGATYVYGPQKGAAGDILEELEAGMLNMEKLLNAYSGSEVCSANGAGAAGGMGAILMAVFGARCIPGAEAVLEIVGFDRALKKASLVITGEGRVDSTSLNGKAVGSVLAHSRKAGVTTAIIAGSRGEGAEEAEKLVAVNVYCGTGDDAASLFDKAAAELVQKTGYLI